MHIDPPSKTDQGPASQFTGDVYLTPIHPTQEGSRLRISLVRFTPGARTHWHSHANGQTLFVTDGIGLVVSRDRKSREWTVIVIKPGDSIWTPRKEEHWHGGTADSMMCHLAMLEEDPDIAATTWLEPVTDDEYRAAISLASDWE
jgi:quercetin dioxygenase-like cupin family protein